MVSVESVCYDRIREEACPESEDLSCLAKWRTLGGTSGSDIRGYLTKGNRNCLAIIDGVDLFTPVVLLV
jgi:hypothetical protein